MPYRNIKYYTSIAWKLDEDSFSDSFYKEFAGMAWSGKDSSISEDKEDWKNINQEDRELVMVGLVILKIYKHFVGSFCMPTLIDGLDYSYPTRKSILATIMDRLLSTHAFVISNMFATFTSSETMTDIYNELVGKDAFSDFLIHLKLNTNMLSTYNIQKNMQEGMEGDELIFNRDAYNKILWQQLALVTLVIDIAYLMVFYGILTNATANRFKHSRESIQLMYRDVNIITTYLSTLAAEEFQYFDNDVKFELEAWFKAKTDKAIFDTNNILEQRKMRASVKDGLEKYLEYTLNKTLFKLGFNERYDTVKMPTEIEKAVLKPFNEDRYKFIDRRKDTFISDKGIIKRWLNKIGRKIK